MTAHGLKDASQLQITIREWWQRWPNANIAIVCNGLLVMDWDVKDGGLSDGKPTLIARYGDLTRTRVNGTGGGGEHWLYKVPTDLNIRPGAKKYGFAGLDIRANDSYILVPPSKTTGEYTVIDDSPVAPAPEWLIELAKTPTPAKITTTGGTIPEGQRNVNLASLAGSMRRRGASPSAIEAALFAENAKCNPPLPDREVLAIVGSISRYEPAPVATRQNSNKSEPAIKMPSVKSMADVQPQAVRYIWHPYIPQGKLVILEGDPGTGKSWASLAIATTLTTRGTFPGETSPYDPYEKCNVLLATGEDGTADTIRPRLDLLGADCNFIYFFDGLFTLNDEGIAHLEAAISEFMPVLTIIDPLIAYISGEVDIHKADAVRQITARLAKLADDYSTTILAIRHLTKSASSKAIYRGSGSIDFTASARSVLSAGQNDDGRGFVHVKSNLAPEGEPVGYEITNEGFFWKTGCTLTKEQIMSNIENTGTALEVAKAFLREVLDGGAEVESSEIFREAKEREIAQATLYRAKDVLNIIVKIQGNTSGKRGRSKSVWVLP